MSSQQNKINDSKNINKSQTGSFMNLRNQRLKREKSFNIINYKHQNLFQSIKDNTKNEN